MKNNNYKHFTNIEELINILTTIDNIKDPNVKGTYFNIVKFSTYSAADYFKSEIKINGEFKKISFEIEQLDCKIHHQVLSVDNKPSKVQVSFNIKNSGKYGELFMLLDKLFNEELLKKFKPPTYNQIISMVQKTANIEKEGIKETIQLEEPNGWIVMKNLVTVDRFKKTPSVIDKTRFGGILTIIKQNPQNSNKTESYNLENPKFEELPDHWSSRAFVSGTISLDNVTVLTKLNKVLITVNFKKDTMVVLPKNTNKNSLTKTNNIKKLMNLSSIIEESDVSTDTDNTTPQDFDTI